MKRKIPYFALFAGILLLSYRFFLLKFSSIGHNWDWTFPALEFLSSRMLILSRYTWYGFDLGGQLDLTISHLVPNGIFSWISGVVHIKGAIFLLLFLVELVSFCSFKKLLDYLLEKDRNINYTPALLFSFSPFLFNEMIGGSWYMWISYASSPLFFLSLARFIESKQMKYLCAFLFSSIFVLTSLQNFVLIEIIFVLYFVGSIFVEKYSSKKAKTFLMRYFFVHIIFLFFNSYWIAPFLSLQDTFQKTVLSHGFVGDFTSVEHAEQGIVNIFSLVGYLDRNLYYHVVSSLPMFWIVVFSLLVLIVWAVFFRKTSQIKKNGVIWFSIILALILVIKGGQPPFSSATMSFFKIFPLMNLYRSPQHLMFGAAVIVPILVAFSLNFLYEKSKFKNAILSFFTVAIVIWISGWWMTGDLGSEDLKKQKRDTIDFYSLSPGLIKVYGYNEISKLDHKIIFLPAVFSPYYLKNEYQGDGQGGQPEYMYLKNPTFRSETNIFAKNIEGSFCLNNRIDLARYLSLTSTRYVSARLDILPKFTKCAKLNLWNGVEVIDKINNNQDLKLIFGSEYSFLYSIDDEKYLPHFYAPQYSIISQRTIEDLPKILSKPDWKTRSTVFFREQNGGKENVLDKLKNNNNQSSSEAGDDNCAEKGGVALPTLEFKKINPTKYRVRVHSASGVFPIIFSESFHDGWKSYLVKSAPSSLTSSALRGTLPTGRQASSYQGEGSLENYKILDGNVEDQATRDELQNYIDSGFVTTLGDGKEKTIKHKKWENNQEKLDYVEKYNIDFVSKNFQDTIQNDNLPKGNIFETWLQKPIENNENHLMANGYANSWVVDTNLICNPASSSPQPSPRPGEGAIECIKNPDGSYDFEMIVEFWPQRLFYVGLAISGLTLLGCVGYLGYDWRKRKKLDPK